MARRATVILALLVFLGPALASIGAGDRAADAGNYRLAISEYQASIAGKPDNAEAYYKMARATTYLAERAEGEEAETLYAEAVSAARAAIALDPNDAEGHFELSRALGRLTQFRGVLQSLNLARQVRKELDITLELDPTHALALHALALWHMEVPWIAGGRKGQVAPLFEQSIALEPEVISHHTDFGESLLKLGESGAARQQLELALSLTAITDQDHFYQEKAHELLDDNF